MSRPIMIPAVELPRPLDVLGEKMTVLATADQTDSYEVFHQTGVLGSGPPPHFHPWDEAFVVIKGELSIGVGDEEVTGGPGTFVHVPRGTVHWFTFLDEDGEMISVTSGAGAAAVFAEVDRQFAAGENPAEKMVENGDRFGVTVVLPDAPPGARNESIA